MSTLRVNTLQDATGSNQPAMVGAAKAWVNFNGTGTVAIREQFNVSSITDLGTGAYEVNFMTLLQDENYVPVSMSTSSSGETQPRQITYKGTTKTTSTLTVVSETDNGTNFDPEFAFVVIFR